MPPIFPEKITEPSTLGGVKIPSERRLRMRSRHPYRTGDLYQPKGGGRPSSQQTVPLYVDKTLYVTSAFGRVIALDPDTGKPKWSKQVVEKSKQ